MEAGRAERAYEKHAWWLLVAVSIFSLLFVIFFLLFLLGVPSFEHEVVRTVTGQTWDQIVADRPGVANLIRELYWELALTLFGFSVLSIWIASTGFRKGQRWAWYALWMVPVFWLGLVGSLGVGNPFPILLAVSVLGLLLPYRRFFPREIPGKPESGRQ